MEMSWDDEKEYCENLGVHLVTNDYFKRRTKKWKILWLIMVHLHQKTI